MWTLEKKEDDDSDSVTEENEDALASAVLQKQRKRCGDSIYMNTHFLQPTSNSIERFLSMAGYPSSDYRQQITPEHLEELLFLKANAQFWKIDTVVDVLNK